MAKQPSIETIENGYSERHKLNQTFKAIQDKFEEMLSRSGDDTPNFMEVDLDIADANITNVNKIVANELTIGDSFVSTYGDTYVYALAQLSCNAGAILTHDADGDPICLPPGDNGEVLKSRGGTVGYEADNDEVGVTVQNNGVTIAENVTTINFKLAGKTLVTTPASNQVDLALLQLVGPLWEDTTQDNTNLLVNTTDTTPIGNASVLTRIDLINDVGLSAVPSTDDEYYVIAEASEWIDSAGSVPISGNYDIDVAFYDNTGSTTPATGVRLFVSASEIGNDNAGNASTHALHVVFCGIPAGTRYIDFGWSTVPTVPAGVVDAAWSDRYRAVVAANIRDTFLTPNNKGYPSANYTTVTPDPNP